MQNEYTYLCHHGIKGQKWGERKYQYEDGTYTEEGRRRYGVGEARQNMINKKAAYKLAKKESNKSFNKAYNKSLAAYSPFKRHRIANRERWEDFYDKNKAKENAKNEYKKAKSEYKNAKNRETRNAVKTYSKQFNKASNMEDKSDALFRKASEQHKSLGKTPISRMKAVMDAQKGKGSKAAKEYLKTWNKANALGDKAYDEWKKSNELYRKTGKNRVSRILNNVRYSH